MSGGYFRGKIDLCAALRRHAGRDAGDHAEMGVGVADAVVTRDIRWTSFRGGGHGVPTMSAGVSCLERDLRALAGRVPGHARGASWAASPPGKVYGGDSLVRLLG